MSKIRKGDEVILNTGKDKESAVLCCAFCSQVMWSLKV